MILLIFVLLVQTNTQQLKQHSFVQIKATTSDDDKKESSSGISEKKAKQIIENEFEKLDDHMQSQNQDIIIILNNSTAENLKVLNESIYNITEVVDKMVYHIDKKITTMNDQLQDVIKTTEEMAYFILQDQLEKVNEDLILIVQQIKDLKDVIGPLMGTCDQYFSCAECQTNVLCGWCSMEEKCVLGDADGPLYVMCSFYFYDYCSGRQCSQYTTCQSCLSDPECGWCADRQRMLSGCIEQPADYQGCPAEGWFHIEGKLNQCSTYIVSLETPPEDESKEDWARSEQKPPVTKKQTQKEKEMYEQEKQNVLEDRQKLIDSVTPAEKRQALKKAQVELDEKQKKYKALKIKKRQVQAKLDEISIKMIEEQESSGEEE